MIRNLLPWTAGCLLAAFSVSSCESDDVDYGPISAAIEIGVEEVTPSSAKIRLTTEQENVASYKIVKPTPISEFEYAAHDAIDRLAFIEERGEAAEAPFEQTLAGLMPKVEYSFAVVGLDASGQRITAPTFARFTTAYASSLVEARFETNPDETFTFTGKTELPEVAYLSRDKEQPFVRFFLENARISIDGNLYNPNEVYPTGTAANEAMNAFNELTFNTSEAYGVTELEADKKQLVDRYKQQMRETIDRNRDNICGMIILAETGSMFFTPQEVLAEIDRFPAEWQQRTELTDLRKVMEQRLRTTVGQPYVDISAPNADGEAVSLKSVIENPANKYVLVDFWASWCGPCLREIPYLQADYEKYRKKGFEIYAVSLDDERDAWVKTIADKQMKWIQVCDFKAFDSPASLDYAVESIPSNFLIRCSDGQIVAAQLRGKALGEKLEELLGK
mgnify:CR=1 FL=1